MAKEKAIEKAAKQVLEAKEWMEEISFEVKDLKGIKVGIPLSDWKKHQVDGYDMFICMNFFQSMSLEADNQVARGMFAMFQSIIENGADTE